MQFGISKSLRDHSGSCPQQKSISLRKTKLTLLCNAQGLINSNVALNFTKLQKFAITIQSGYCHFHKGRLPSLSEVNLLYSPKNMTLSNPRHVGDSVT
ncbi:hypothetical protein AVEN_30306-1 [Araneus ventricosus]|uniref:Uncharacterized protein n=1 Tax=Araneus ventricosus TaxID=182803 RepID=A0A4Y2VWE4_ARAVE|nr:hypothetical protein AVEN_56333-1 [Araneus ventricosus]GBO29001.1 hypothetical protein AVEN_30306-1 [Araneus ventricosus]